VYKQKVYHIFHTNVCIIHIYKDLYVYSHTLVSTCWVVVGDWVTVAPISDDIDILLGWKNWGSIGCSPLTDVSLHVYLCVFTDTVWPWVFENLQQLHILDLSIEWFLTSFFGPPHWANLVVKTSGNFIGLDIFPRTFGQDLLQSRS